MTGSFRIQMPNRSTTVSQSVSPVVNCTIFELVKVKGIGGTLINCAYETVGHRHSLPNDWEQGSTISTSSAIQ